MDQVFEMMSSDEDMGPRLLDAEVPQRFEFPDMDLVVNIALAMAEEHQGRRATSARRSR